MIAAVDVSQRSGVMGSDGTTIVAGGSINSSDSNNSSNNTIDPFAPFDDYDDVGIDAQKLSSSLPTSTNNNTAVREFDAALYYDTPPVTEQPSMVTHRSGIYICVSNLNQHIF